MKHYIPTFEEWRADLPDEDGHRPSDGERITCEHCSGSGRVKHDDFNPTQSRCEYCDGEGFIPGAEAA